MIGYTFAIDREYVEAKTDHAQAAARLRRARRVHHAVGTAATLAAVKAAAAELHDRVDRVAGYEARYRRLGVKPPRL